MFYLSRGNFSAKNISEIIRKITNNNPEYEEVYEEIEKNGFRIEPEIITRESNKGIQISESVSLNIRNEDRELIEKITSLTREEQREIISQGGLSNVREIMNTTFAKEQRKESISKEEYYSEAIFSLYDWEKIGIQEFTQEERKSFLDRMKKEHVVELYEILEKAEITRDEIPKVILNLITRRNNFEIEDDDTADKIKEKRIEQYRKYITEDLEIFKTEMSVERVERFLGYYDVEKTDIKLRPYQQRAHEKVSEIYKDKRFASVVLPTGSGKSFVTIAQLMEHQNEEILYLAPQNEILEQMKDYIIEYVHGKINTVGRSKEAIIADVFPNIKFATYPGLLGKDGKEIINKKYGFVVVDEAHRTGREKDEEKEKDITTWREKLDELLDNQAEATKVLGITATPRRDSDGINMLNEIAEKLGYTNEEAVSGKHMAMNLSLTNAIRLGLIVNPKLVSCAYNLSQDGTLDKTKEKIDEISNVEIRNRKLEEYEKVRRNLEEVIGISEILQENIKKGGKYIVFLPVVDNIEDEDGNIIGRKKGKDKIADYQKQLEEYFKDTDIKVNFHSMLGEYGDKENLKRLKEFENSSQEETQLLLVMNKANEGLHIENLNGIIWLRPLDENSRTLYLQQLGRAIYSEDPDNKTKDEDRPTVIDLVNNTLKVKWEEEYTEQSDIELLTLILDWTQKHNQTLPDINSTDKEEAGYAKVLKEIQNKYIKYKENGTEELDDDKSEEIDTILNLGSQIDLWRIELSDKIKKETEKTQDNKKDKEEIGPFEIEGILKDFIELEKTVDAEYYKSTIEEYIETLESLQDIGVDVSKMIRKDTIKTLVKKSNISEETLIELGFNIEQKIGSKKEQIASVYRGRAKGTKPTEEQVERLANLGICLEKKEITGKDIAKASIDAVKDPDLLDAEDNVLKAEVEKVKGGKNKDEQS